jgi:hypothetical protein
VIPAEKRCGVPVKVIDVRIQPASGEPMHRFRRALTALLAGVVVTIATVGVTAPAQAEPDSQTNASDTTIQTDGESDIGVQAVIRAKLQNNATGRCLQASSSSSAVVTRPCSSSSLQNWIVTHTGSVRTFKNIGNGWCLDGSTSSMYTHVCNTGSYQKWYSVYDEQIGFRWMSAGTGKCLDSNSQGSVYPHTCNTGRNQRWWFQPTSE